VRRFQVAIGDEDDVDPVAGLDGVEDAPLFVQQESGHINRQLRDHLAGFVLHGLFLDDPQHREGQRFHAAHRPLAAAAAAELEGGFAERGAQALARHLEQAEPGNPANLDTRPVLLDRLAQPVFNLPLVPVGAHVDEVDHDQAAKIAQAQLAGDLLGGFDIGLECGLLDVRALGGAGGVDVDRDQRFGMVDDDHATAGQPDLALEGRFDLALDLIAAEQRHLVIVEFELLQVVGHHLLDELTSALVDIAVINEDFADIRAQVVAQGPDDDIALLVDQEGRRPGLRRLLHGAPEIAQVVQIPLQLLGIAPDAGGAHDQAHALRHIEFLERVADLVALGPLDAPRDAAGPRIVGHQDQVAASEADESGQCSALVAALLLLHLDHDLEAFLDDIGDRRLGRIDIATEVLAGDLLEGQKAVALRTVLDEGGLEAGLDPRDPSLVDVGFFTFPCRCLDIQVVE